jgi:hypothetical protein
MRSMISTTGPTQSSARWAGDYRDRDHLIPGGFKVDATQFAAADRVVVDVGAAGAAQFAVAVPVAALTGPIPRGAVITFGGGKSLRLAADSPAGAVSHTTDPIPLALVDADVSEYPGAGGKYVPSGTVVGRTFAERDANTGFGPAADADDEVYLIAFDLSDVTHIDDAEMYRPNSQVYENFVPGWAGLSATVKGKVRARYLCSNGAP